LRLKDCATPALLRGYIVRTYYVSTGAILKMAEFADGNLTTVSLVDGIENMQFEYGLDTTDDGAPDSYTAAPTAAQWENVMAVRVYLLARNNETTPGYTDAKIYNLGAAASAVAPGGAYKRHAYSQLVRATNPSGRRE
jgi:type IV pilus assembly protein PilW